MLLNCMTEESDDMRDATAKAKGEPTADDDSTMEFKPKNKGAVDLGKMPLADLNEKLFKDFGTHQGGGA